MQFDSLAALWTMGGHGPYVWSAYALALLILGALVWAPLARQRRFFNEQRASLRRRAARAQSTDTAQ